MEEKIEAALELVNKLQKLRKVPQFIFVDEIYPSATICFRKKILKFKSENQTINEIDFIINSPGGSADDAYRIIRTLRNNFEKVNIIVPFWAKSAATILCLGGSLIVMDEFAEFGPLDVQVAKEKDDSPGFERESALNDEHSLKRIEDRSKELFHSMFVDFYQSETIPIHKNELAKLILEYLASFYEPLVKQINTYKLGDRKRKLAIGEQYVDRILQIYNKDLGREKRLYLIDYLVNECPDHGYVIDYGIISKFLSNVIKAEKFGQEYKKILSQLSEIFMETDSDNIRYIGFLSEFDRMNKEKTARKSAPQSKIKDENKIKKGNIPK